MHPTPWPTPDLPSDIQPSRIPYNPATPLLRPYTTLAAEFHAGTDSPTAFLDRCLAAIDQREPAIRAFVLLNREPARQSAALSTQRWASGAPLSPVDGMPVAVKDMIETRDMPTQMNSPIYQGWNPRRDAAAVWALRQAGAVILGKTVTTEFAVSNSGPTRNPYDSQRTPGGSSSGSAAAVGAGMASLALGTQTQASTIRPAGYCGAYALKPTHDALHIGGVTPLAPTQDHLGIIGASLEDVWAGARAIARFAGGTPPHPGLQGPDRLPPPIRPRALARLDMQGWAETPQTSQTAFESALKALESQGIPILDRHTNKDVAALEHALADANDYSYDILAWEVRWPLLAYNDHGPDKVGRRIHELLTHAATLDFAAYQRALDRRTNLRALVAALEPQIDAFLTLCSSGPAIQDHAFTGSRSFALPWTMVAAPAIALPLLTDQNLPLGLQLCGFQNQDAKACAQAAYIRNHLS